VVLGRIMDWVRLPVKTQSVEGIVDFIHSRDVRLKFLFSFLDRHPLQSTYLANTLQELIVPGSAVGLYCLTGISENTGFIYELSNRLVQGILPDTYTEEDLAEIFKVLFTKEEDAVWIETSLKNILPLFNSFAERHNLSFDGLKFDRKEAMVILGAQVATLGTTKAIRRRLSGKRLTDYSFIRLNAVINSGEPEDVFLQEISRSRSDLQTVRSNIETSGVSVDLIFKLEKIHAILDRIEMLIYLGKKYEKATTPIIIGQFFGRLIRDDQKRLGVKVYIQENLHLLTRKIVERSGEKGEHYIAGTKKERHELFVASTWAGVLTAFTAIMKFLIGIQGFPIFFEGFFFFLNYALGFLCLQKWHLALSSKQPAYTASALSRKFEAFKQSKELSEISLEIKKIMHSQYLTAVGNLLWVVPVVIAFDWIWFFISGHHIMTMGESHLILSKHNIFTSMTIPYSILTGVLLWLSSVAGGWVENWVVFREIPEAMKNNQILKKMLGKDQLNFVAKNFAGTIGGIAGNLTIAFFLAAPIVISKFTGLPLDIRHVTLAAGTVTLALNAVEWNIFEYWDTIIVMGLSIAVIGILNFSVSFYCALRMAATARNVESKYLKIIFKYSFRKSPGLRPDSKD
jgi:site-specific recombinase